MFGITIQRSFEEKNTVRFYILENTDWKKFWVPTMYRTAVSSAQEHAMERPFIQRDYLGAQKVEARGGRWRCCVQQPKRLPLFQWAEVSVPGTSWLIPDLKHCPHPGASRPMTLGLWPHHWRTWVAEWTVASRCLRDPLRPQHLWEEAEGWGKILFKKELTPSVRRQKKTCLK